MIKIRPMMLNDFPVICEIISSCGMYPPKEPADMGGICLVAEECGNVIGTIWALVGNSTQAYIGYLAVMSEHEGKGVYSKLKEHLETLLRWHGVKRYRFVTNKNNEKFLPRIGGLGIAQDTVSVWGEII